MRLKILLLVSLALNAIFFAAWFFGDRNTFNSVNAPPVPDIESSAVSNHTQTNVVLRRQNFTWEEVESDDYVTYIKNLREIGCPPATIRDIIVADVNVLYGHRRATEVISADHQWWLSEPDLDAVQNASEKLKSIETERLTLLTRLLGQGWDTAINLTPPATRTGVSLTGPVLGDLSAEIKQTVYDIAARTQQKIEAYQQAQKQAGMEMEPQELLKLRLESREELSKILTPPQLEEFFLRYSQTAHQLRSELRGLNVSAEEFRKMFQARDPLNQSADAYYSGADPAQLKRKQELEFRQDTALQEVLGKERYGNYKLYRDPLFHESQATAERLGAPAALLMPIYEINQLTEAERQRIRNDATLSEDAKVDALAAAQAEQEKSLQKIVSLQAQQPSPGNTNAPPR